MAPTQGDEATAGYTPTRTPQSPVVRPRSRERSELPQIGGIGDGAAIPEAIAGEGPRPSSRADWHCRGPPGPGANANALSSMYVPLLLHSAGMQGAAAAAQWEAMSWFQTSREALSYNPAQLLEAITRGAAAGAATASQEELERLRAAAAPGGHVTIAEPVRSLARATVTWRPACRRLCSHALRAPTGEATSQATRQLCLRARKRTPFPSQAHKHRKSASLAFFCSFGAMRPWTGSACSITHNTVHATRSRLKTARTQPCQLCPTGIAAERPLAAGYTLLQKKTAKLETAATHAAVYQASRISADCASST